MVHFVGAVPWVSSRGRHRLSSELSAYSQGDSGFSSSLRSKVRSSGGCGTAWVSSLSLCALLWRFYLMCPRRPASVRLSTEIKEFKKSHLSRRRLETLQAVQQEVQLPTFLKCSTAELDFSDLNVFRNEATGLVLLMSLSVLLLWSVVCGWSAARGDQRLEGRFHCQVTWDDRHSAVTEWERGGVKSSSDTKTKPLFHLDSLLRNKKVDVLLRHSDPPSPMNLSSSCVSPACSSTFILHPPSSAHVQTISGSDGLVLLTPVLRSLRFLLSKSFIRSFLFTLFVCFYFQVGFNLIIF